MDPQATTQTSESSADINASEADPINPGQDSVSRVTEKPSAVKQRKRKTKGGLLGIIWKTPPIVIVSVAIALVGGIANWSIARYSGRQKSVELAVSILREPLKDEEKKGEVLPLRSWAVDVVNKLSEVPFSEDAAKLLRTGQRTLPPREVSFPPVDGYCEVMPETTIVGAPVTFAAFGNGGSGLYVYSWLGDDGLTSQNRTVTVRYHVPGKKAATVRITSNGQSVYRTATVEITPAAEEGDPP